jgi:hypothetical protein
VAVKKYEVWYYDRDGEYIGAYPIQFADREEAERFTDLEWALHPVVKEFDEEFDEE